MQIGPAAPPHDALLLGIVYSSATASYLGHLNGSIRYLAPAQRLSIAELQMLLQRLHGYVTCSMTSAFTSRRLPWSTATTSRLSISLLIPFNINERSTSKSISISFENESHLVWSASCTFLLIFSTLTYLLKAYQLHCSHRFAPA